MNTISAMVKSEGMTLARFIWATFRRQPVGLLEAALELNPGLAATVTLPVGKVILFPAEMVAASTGAAPRQVIRLWD